MRVYAARSHACSHPCKGQGWILHVFLTCTLLCILTQGLSLAWSSSAASKFPLPAQHYNYKFLLQGLAFVRGGARDPNLGPPAGVAGTLPPPQPLRRDLSGGFSRKNSWQAPAPDSPCSNYLLSASGSLS